MNNKSFWMISSSCLVLLIAVPFLSYAQKPLKVKYTTGGIFSLGVRIPGSLAESPDGINFLQGIGCQSRVQLAKHYNTQWFVDYLRGKYGNASVRNDLHFGGEFMLYPQLRLHRVQPFVALGPLASYSKMHEQADISNAASIWNIGAQGGLGTHINVTWRTDITISVEYLFLFGNKIEPLVTGDQIFFTSDHTGSNGQLLITLSMNFKMLDLWKKIRW